MYYSLAKLMTNVFLLSFYAIQMFAVDHIPCIWTGFDVTERFEISLFLGFVVLIADIVNSTILALYFQ